MYYTVTCDGNYIYHLKRGYTLIDPVLDLADNSAGSFEFTIAPDHPMYDKINTLTSEIIVYRDNKEIWSGRPIEEHVDFYKRKNIYCEGELAYLNDSIQSPAEFHDNSVRQWLTTLIDNHNKQVSANKQFAVGAVTVEENLYRYTNYDTTMFCIEDKLINRLGGHLRVRKENGKRYLDYLKDYPKRSTQVVKFGRNLLDYSTNFTMADIATVIIPLGAMLDRSPIDALEAYLDVSSVNNKSIYVRNEEAIRNFGWICQVVHWDDVTTPAALLTKAQQYLAAIQYDNMTLEIRPVDFNLVDSNEPALDLLDEVRVISKPHGLDKWFPITEQKIPLGDPENETCTMGIATQQSFTSKTSSSMQDIRDAIEKITPESTILKQAQENATQLIISGALGSHVVVKPDEILVMDTADENTAKRAWRWNVKGLGYSSNGTRGPFGLAMTMDGRIVADYITAGTMSANRIKGGTLTLGGQSNGNGTIIMKDYSNVTIGTWDNTGFNLKRGNINLDSGSLIRIPLDNKNKSYISMSSEGFRLQFENGYVQTENRTYYGSTSVYPTNVPLGSWALMYEKNNTVWSASIDPCGLYANKYPKGGGAQTDIARVDVKGLDVGKVTGNRIHFDSEQGEFDAYCNARVSRTLYVDGEIIPNRGLGNNTTVYLPSSIGAGGVITGYYTAKLHYGLLLTP